MGHRWSLAERFIRNLAIERWCLLVSIALAGFACSDALKPELVLEVAYIVDEIDFPEPSISVIANGDQVQISILTLGSSCYSLGRLAIAEDGSRVTVTPYNYHRVRSSGTEPYCVRASAMLHEATLEFDVPRPWTILVRGRRYVAGDIITVERAVE